MADFNDVLFKAIEKNTRDDIRPATQPSSDNELLKAILHLLTITLKRMVDEPIEPATEVVPFVS